MKHPFEQFNYCPKCGSPKFVVNNEKSKKCNNCNFTYYFNPSAATVAVIINENKELLVCKRGKSPAKGTLDLPGGFIDCSECAEEGLKREVKEETGLNIKEIKYLFSLPNIYTYSDFEVHTLDLFFLCQADNKNPLKAMDDISDSFYLPINEINIDDFGLSSIKKGLKKIIEVL